MKTHMAVVLSALLAACVGGPGTEQSLAPPPGVPLCPKLNQYGGYQGGLTEIKGVLKAAARPYHMNDMMYVLMGQQAENNLVLMGVALANMGSSQLMLEREAIRMEGDDGTASQALKPEQILLLSRGSDPKATNVLEESGERILKKQYGERIQVVPGAIGELGVAFALPLPRNPRVAMGNLSVPVQIPICWGPPGSAGQTR